MVKSAYKVALDSHSNSNHLANGFRSQDHFVSLWKNIWHAHIPASAKVCIWKACVDILPTKESLMRKQVVLESTVCTLCNAVLETTFHLCCQCHFSQQVFNIVEGISLCYPADFIGVSMLYWLLFCL